LDRLVGVRDVRRGVVSAADTLVGVCSTGRGHGATSVSGVVAGACVVGNNRCQAAVSGGSRRNSSDFRVAKRTVAILALPELHAGAAGVVVGWGRTVALLLLVVLAEEDAEGNGEEEEDGSSNRNSEARSVQPADRAERSRVRVLALRVAVLKALLGILGPISKRRLDVVALARVRTVTGQDCNSDEATHAENVHNESKKSEKGLSAETACEDDSEDGVEDDGTGNTLDGLLPTRNGIVAVGLHGQEVAVDAEDDASAAELKGVEEGGPQTQGSAADSHYVWGCVVLVWIERRDEVKLC